MQSGIRGIVLAASLLSHSFGSQEALHNLQQDGADMMKREVRENLERTVHVLAREIGSRGHYQLDELNRAADYISGELTRCGYEALEQPYEYKGRSYKNVYAVKEGRELPEKILVIGAHYDTVTGTPGADDNASAVAGLLELARLLAGVELKKTLHFVAFTLEEPPLFRSRYMGSYIYAGSLRQRGAAVEGMICLEMIGYFSDEPGSQFFPLPFMRWIYPERGNFITLVSNLQSRAFLNRVKKGFQMGTALPVESLATLAFVPGVDFSDHRSFWKFGYEAIMVTDTAFYRNPQYHGSGDVPELLDYDRMAEVVLGLKAAIEAIAKGQ